VDRLLSQGEPIPDTNFHIPLMSTMLALGTDLQTIPEDAAYLAAEPRRVEKWRSVLRASANDHRPLIGVAWRGRALAAHSDQGRYLLPKHLTEVAGAADVRLVCLQKDARKDELDAMPVK